MNSPGERRTERVVELERFKPTHKVLLLPCLRDCGDGLSGHAKPIHADRLADDRVEQRKRCFNFGRGAVHGKPTDVAAGQVVQHLPEPRRVAFAGCQLTRCVHPAKTVKPLHLARVSHAAPHQGPVPTGTRTHAPPCRNRPWPAPRPSHGTRDPARFRMPGVSGRGARGHALRLRRIAPCGYGANMQRVASCGSISCKLPPPTETHETSTLLSHQGLPFGTLSASMGQ